jgi:hypothetical protein
MNSYSIALFVHIIGAVGIFISLSLEWVSLRQLRRSTGADQIRAVFPILGAVRRVGMLDDWCARVGFYKTHMAWER